MASSIQGHTAQVCSPVLAGGAGGTGAGGGGEGGGELSVCHCSVTW